MLADDTRSKIENITKGVILEGQPDHCTAARNLLCSRYPTSTTVKKDFESQAIIKKEQAELLARFASEQNLWLPQFPKEESFLTRGGEARVYLDTDNRHVIKLNDAVYYAPHRQALPIMCHIRTTQL